MFQLFCLQATEHIISASVNHEKLSVSKLSVLL